MALRARSDLKIRFAPSRPCRTSATTHQDMCRAQRAFPCRCSGSENEGTIFPIVDDRSPGRKCAGCGEHVWEILERESTKNRAPSKSAGKLCEWKPRGNGGEGGIRTHDTLAGMPHFECGAFDHSATSPDVGRRPWSAGRYIAGVGRACKGAGARKMHLFVTVTRKRLDSFQGLAYCARCSGIGLSCAAPMVLCAERCCPLQGRGTEGTD